MTLQHPTAAAYRSCRVIATLIPFAAVLSAQTAPAPTAAQIAQYDANKNGVLDPDERTAMTAATSGETIVLTPFEVNTERDRGYAAGNTLSGGRVNTPLALTSASISVMTKEFLDDFDITDVAQAAAWTLSMDAPNATTGPFGGDRFESNFRGAGGSGNYPQRDGVQQYFVADSYNSERFEFSRGPNAQMFGVGAPGGLQGSTSKQARLNSRSVGATARVDTYGSYRFTLDYSQGFDKFGVRVNALHQNTKSYQDGTGNKQNAITVSATYRITNKTQLRAQYEKSSEWNVLYRKTYAEQASIWNGTTVNENNTALTNPGLAGLQFLAGNATTDRVIYNTGTKSLINYRGNQYTTVGLGYQIPWEGRTDIPNFRRGFSKSFALGPADVIADRDNNTRSITLEHRFSPNLFAQLSWSGSDVDPTVPFLQGLPGDYRIDVNRLLPSGANNPNFLKAYSDVAQNSQYQQNTGDDYTLMTNYSFEVPRWFDMKQRFNVNINQRDGGYEAWNRAWRWTNNPAQPNPTNAANTLNFRVYYDQPRPAVASLLNAAALSQLDPTKTWANISTGFHQLQVSQSAYAQVVSQTNFFNDRLALSWGVRRDRTKSDVMANIGNDAANGYAIIMGNTNPATLLQEAGYHARSTTYRTGKNAGVVAYPFPARFRFMAPIGLVANYSENFQGVPSGNNRYNGERPDAPYSKTLDFGLRYSVPNGVAYATLTHYSTDQIGQLTAFGNTGNISNIWINLGYTDPVLTNFGPFRDTSDRKLEGWEFELTANPTNRVTFTANYSHPMVKTVSESPDRRAYVAAHLAEWQAGAAANPGDIINGRAIVDPTVIQQSIQAIEDSFNGSTAGTIGNGPRHRINLAGSYKFTEGSLRGLGLVAGVNYRSHNKVGSRDPRLKFQTTAPTVKQTAEAAWDYLWVPPVTTYTLGANYTRRFGKYQFRFQLNVTNPFNETSPDWNSYGVIQAGQLTGQASSTALTVPGSNPRMQVLNGFSQQDPRKFALTTSVAF